MRNRYQTFIFYDFTEDGRLFSHSWNCKDWDEAYALAEHTETRVVGRRLSVIEKEQVLKNLRDAISTNFANYFFRNFGWGNSKEE